MGLFSSRPDHLLGDAKELKRVLAELPTDNAFKTVDEIYGWFESLRLADDFRVDHFFAVVRQLDEAAQAAVRQLSRTYLQTAPLSKSEERRVWSLCYNYWGEVSCLYARCIDRVRQNPRERGADQLKTQLPLAATRLLAARVSQLKWVEYRYEPIGEDLWRGLGQPYLAAEVAGYAQSPVQLYPTTSGMTSVAAQYLQALVFYASSMDSLLPIEVELAERLVAHFLPFFSLSTQWSAGNVYSVDAGSGLPPQRLARPVDSPSPGLRYFSPSGATRALSELIASVELGQVPADINLGGQYRPSVLLPVLRHLARYWAAEPPQREHARHAVKTRIAVLHGFDDCFTVFAGDVARLGKERSAASWVVENVSLGGFGVRIDDLSGESVAAALRVGALLCIQPEGGENWVIGVLRRFNKDSGAQAHIGVETLSTRAQSVELRPRTTGFSATGTFPGIFLGESSVRGEVRLVLPSMSFDVRVSLDVVRDGRRALLVPVELEETGNGFEVGRYRETSAE